MVDGYGYHRCVLELLPGLVPGARVPGSPGQPREVQTPALGAEWERRSAASCGQTRSDAVIVAASIASDVRQRRQTVGLLAGALSSGRRGRRFRSAHPDEPGGLTESPVTSARDVEGMHPPNLRPNGKSCRYR